MLSTSDSAALELGIYTTRYDSSEEFQRIRFRSDGYLTLRTSYDASTSAAGDSYTATTQLPEQRLTGRNRFYVTDNFYGIESFQSENSTPYWVRTNDNGADIYTKAVPPQFMKQLRPGQTGYSDGPLPAIDKDHYTKNCSNCVYYRLESNRNTSVRLGGCRATLNALLDLTDGYSHDTHNMTSQLPQRLTCTCT